MGKKIIAWDLGTGGNKASLYDAEGHCLASDFHSYNTTYPNHGWHEQKPSDWWNAVVESTQRLMQKTGVDKDDIVACGISGHSLGAVPIGKNGELLRQSTPIWSDGRAEKQSAEFFSHYDETRWYNLTGNGFTAAFYTAFKIMWYRDNEPEMYRQIDKVIGTKDYINYRLTGRMCTDPSYASGFGVFNLKKWGYEERFMQAAGLSRSLFPEIIPSDGVVGRVTPQAALETGLAPGTPVACGAVDNTCMALGSTGLAEGSVYTSLGSSSWIAVTSREPILDVKTRPFVFAHARKGYYTSAVSIFSAGNSFRWARDNLCRDLKADVDAYDRMNEMAEGVPAGSNGVLFNPTLAGGSAQEPSPNLMGGFMGLTLRNTREDLVRAVMEGIALSLRSALDILKEQTTLHGSMLLCGGGSKSRVWRQIFADVYHMPVLKTNIDQNAASLGAAALAANACGLWQGYDPIAACHQPEDLSRPREAQTARYEQLLSIYRQWTDALAGLSDQMARLNEA